MPSRHQDGHVYERGARRRVWVGSYYVYTRQADGPEKRRHKQVVLGEKSKLRKWEAEEKLRALILEQNATTVQADPNVTLSWFVDHRFIPMRSSTWAPSTKKSTRYDIDHYIRPTLGSKRLIDVDLFACQSLLNEINKKYSEWIVKRTRTILGAILETAVDLEFLRRNPAKKMKLPKLRESVKPVLAPEVLRSIIDGLTSPRDRAIFMLGVFCAMRPSEIFGLQWESYDGEHIRVSSVAIGGKFYELQSKTRRSRDPIYVPAVVRLEIEKWRKKTSGVGLMFPTEAKTPIDPKNWMRDRLSPVLDKLEIKERVTFQILRRSCATRNQKRGTMKDVQSHLRHASIETTANVYMQPIPSSVRKMIEEDVAELMKKQLAVQ